MRSAIGAAWSCSAASATGSAWRRREPIWIPSRSLARRREVSIRAALGASRWRVIRQLSIESVLLGAIGGILGLALTLWGVRMFDLAVANVGKPYWIKFTMDYTV